MGLRLSAIVSDHSEKRLRESLPCKDVTLSCPYAGQSRFAIGAGGGPD